MRILKTDTHIDFLGLRYWGFALSGALIAASLVSLVARGLNFGIDFTGGTVVEIVYEQPVEVTEVRKLLAEAGFGDAVVQYFGTARDLMVRLPPRPGRNSAQLSNAVMAALRQPYQESPAEVVGPETAGAQWCTAPGVVEPRPCKVQMKRVEFVGPQVGDELTEQGAAAMLYALLGILVYVAWRFEWRFSLGAIGALVHDVLITLGFFSITGLEFNLTILAAVLAVIGYSLNDTIVVFDRIRENFPRLRKADTAAIMNASINQTLPRTLLTSFTTLLVLAALFGFGGDVIHGFSLALIVGIVVGTYSSIFVASPLVLHLGLSREDMLPVKKEGADAHRGP